MVAGCHPGECHYIEQNYKAMRRFAMLKHTLRAMGVEPDRVQLVWASAAEGQHWPRRSTSWWTTSGGSARSTGRQLGRRTASGCERPGRHRQANTKRRWRCQHERETQGKLAIYWAASCGGCEIAILAIDEKILDVAARSTS